MPYLRFHMDLAVKKPIPAALQSALPGIKAKILELKAYCEKINEGTGSEENTLIAEYHTCNHDIGTACDPWIDIT